MYVILLLVLLPPAALLLYSGIERGRPRRIAGGALLGAVVASLFWLIGFWGEKLWFDALGYSDRFWTFWLARSAIASGGALLGC